ncbi:LysE family translocator [Grimontia sp. NTOU-MAR1]|uniref:LysE family translocator n=1 Tax=Grimontia sp. NTOU-MAR1 TaxID=3111011 RepID=UPI002DBFEF25|nr:LysE family translocator [Grimontia sp. NTOU-MAR1]WRW00090.1 LysE family translocator [Grimontia sp. NTOU-MAR1]
MSIEVWVSFVLASLALVLSPGPTVFLVIGQSMAYGRKSVLPMILGVISGDIIALTFSLLGVGAILATSSFAFNVMKWLGAGYLIYLGAKAWVSPVTTEEVKIEPVGRSWKVYRDSLLVTALNPKGLVFFMAFFPLFISPESSDIAAQMLILSTTFILISFCSVGFYAFFGGKIRGIISSEKSQRIFNKLSGSMLVGAGLATSTLRQ